MGKYNISKTSKTVNISNELLRHYERLGLIEPERAENGYRFFSFQDLDKLQGIRRFRNMGFSLAEMETLMYTGDYAQVGELYRQALDKARREIVWQREIERVTEQILKEWDALEENVGRFEVVDAPEVLRVNIRHNENLDEIAGSEAVAAWIDRMPAVFISPLFKKEALVSRSPEIWFGYGVTVDVFDRLDMAHIPGETHIPAMRCVTSVIYSRASGHITCRTLEPLLAYCEENGLRVAGDGWGITLGNCDRDGETFRFHRVFVPVEEKQA